MTIRGLNQKLSPKMWGGGTAISERFTSPPLVVRVICKRSVGVLHFTLSGQLNWAPPARCRRAAGCFFIIYLGSETYPNLFPRGSPPIVMSAPRQMDISLILICSGGPPGHKTFRLNGIAKKWFSIATLQRMDIDLDFVYEMHCDETKILIFQIPCESLNFYSHFVRKSSIF